MSKQDYDALMQKVMSLKPVKRTVEEMRDDFERLASMFPQEEDIRKNPVKANGVPAEWIGAPEVDNNFVILYLHGGGYMIGSIRTHRDLAGRISRATGFPCLLIQYRLTPEHPHPAALEDAKAAYRWLRSEGIDASNIVIAGESAGGGLSVATLVSLRDEGEQLPAAAVCISPWVDLEGLGESMVKNADVDPLIAPQGVAFMADAYLNGLDPRTPLAAPLYADLAGLPPMLIQVGTSECLFDDATRLAERAKAAGVAVTFEPWEGTVHMWHFFASILPAAQEAIEHVGKFIRDHLK